MKSSNHIYIDQLTWLRGFAAFLVIISHTIRATEVAYFPGDAPANHGIFSAFDLGTFGVLLFFALSGCTLYISNAAKLKLNTVKRFYIKRFFRIWPAFVVSIIFYLAFRLIFQSHYHYVGDHWIEGQFLDEVSIQDILEQAFLISNFTFAPLVNNAYWSLPVEFQYYLIFPVLVLSARIAGVAGPVFIGIFLYFLPKIVPIDSTRVFVLALSFCGGVSVGYFYLKYQFRLNKYIGLLLLLSGFALVSFEELKWVSLPDVIFISNVWNFYSVMAVVLVFIMLHTSFTLNSKVSAFLQHYGEISYSTYLYHNLVIGALMLILLNYSIEGDARFYILLVGTLLLTQLLAMYSHKYVEVPSQRYGRKF